MTAHRVLAIAALVLAVGAALVGSPRAPGPMVVPPDRVVAEIESGVDRIDAVGLAERLRARERDLAVVDLRDPAVVQDFTVPQAEPRSLGDLLSAPLPEDGVVVLVSDDGSVAAQAWAILRLSGEPGPLVLEGGILGWIRTILMPAVPEDPPPDEREYWGRRVELTEYFGGTPRLVPAGDPDVIRTRGPRGEAAAEVERLVHRGRELGCGW